jgi:purine nucleosidase
MSPRPIIIDCDPGQDDALAILMALGSPEEIEVLAITAVAGNVALALTERNARRIVELAGRSDIPVHAGCDRPLQRDAATAEHVHGRTGLDGADLPTTASRFFNWAIKPRKSVRSNPAAATQSSSIPVWGRC